MVDLSAIMIKGCIFDIGGTLVKTDEALLKAIKMSLRKNGLIPPPDKFIISHFGASSHNNIKKNVERVYSGKNLGYMIKKCYKEYKKIFPKRVIKFFQVFPNAENTLSELKKRNIKIACQTGFSKNEAESILEYFDLMKYFDILITADDVKRFRPHPEAMLLTLKKMGIKRKECFYIGDTIKDIEFAKNSKVKIVCVTTGVQSNKDLEKLEPDFLIDDISEMLKLI